MIVPEDRMLTDLDHSAWGTVTVSSARLGGRSRRGMTNFMPSPAIPACGGAGLAVRQTSRDADAYRTRTSSPSPTKNDHTSGQSRPTASSHAEQRAPHQPKRPWAARIEGQQRCLVGIADLCEPRQPDGRPQSAVNA